MSERSSVSNKRCLDSTAEAETTDQSAVLRDVKRHQRSPSDAAKAEEISATSPTVIVLKNLPEGVNRTDLISIVSPFAFEPSVVFLPSGEALVDFQDAEIASRASTYFSLHSPQIRGVPVETSMSQQTASYQAAPVEASHLPPRANADGLRVLLATVTELRFPVDVDLIYRVFSPHGTVEKIVTFIKPAGFQALIQFAESRQARDAAMALNGKCIYDGCNRMTIQSSKLSQLVVKQNNARSWDFTTAPPPTREVMEQFHSEHVEGIMGSRETNPYGVASVVAGNQYLTHPMQMMAAASPMPSVAYPSQQMLQPTPPFPSHLLSSHVMEKLPRELHGGALQQINPHNNSVVICYNLPPKEISVEKLFNLLSIYGVILKIKLLRDKPDAALIQFADPLYASLACHFLNSAPLFGTDALLQIGISKNQEVKMPNMVGVTPEAAEEAKKTVAFQQRDQRANAEDVEKFVRGACRPTSVLFIANLHETIQEQELRDLFSTVGTVVRIEMRAAKAQSKKLTAMIEMGSEREALSAVCHLHNHKIKDSHLKIAFSKQVLGAKSSQEGAMAL